MNYINTILTGVFTLFLLPANSQKATVFNYTFDMDFIQCNGELFENQCEYRNSTKETQGATFGEDSLALSQFMKNYHELANKGEVVTYSTLDNFKCIDSLPLDYIKSLNYKFWFKHNSEESKLKRIQNGEDSLQNFGAVQELSLIQEWYFNDSSNQFLTRTVSAIPLNHIFDKNGKLRGKKPAYHIKIDGHSEYGKPNNLLENKHVIWGEVFKLTLPLGVNKHQWNRTNYAKQLKSIYSFSFKEILHKKLLSGAFKAFSTESGKELQLHELKDFLKYSETIFYNEGKNGKGEILQEQEFYPLLHSDIQTPKLTIAVKIDHRNYKISTEVKSIIIPYSITYSNSNFELEKQTLKKVEIRF